MPGRVLPPSSVISHRAAMLMAIIALTGCAGDAASSNPGVADTGLTSPEDAVSQGDASPSPATVCTPGTRWSPGTASFIKATGDWGLTGVQGIRFSVTDIDGDGWPDLLIRHGGGPDDFSTEGSRSRWVLRNTGASGVKGFEDWTESSGLLSPRREGAGSTPEVSATTGRAGQLLVSGDVDNDGDLDIWVGTSRTDLAATDAATCELMLNNGDGTFTLGPEQSHARFVQEASNPAGGTFTDVNLDGVLDLWVVHNEMPGLIPMGDRLMVGDGSGAFLKATGKSGLSTLPWQSVATLNEARAHSWGWSGAACDLNDDGRPELLASSYGRAPNHLWRATVGGDGEPFYLNASVDSGYAFDHRVDWRDNISAQCYCADEPSADECDTVPAPPSAELCASFRQAFGGNYRWDHSTGREPFNLGGNSAATMCADVDNDGDIDLMTSEIVHWDVGTNSDPAELLVNTGEPSIRFERPGNEVTGLQRAAGAEDTGWDHGDMTGAVFDFDNDGWQDIYIGASDYLGNQALLFHQDSPLSFSRLEVADYFEHFRAHGVAVADFDRDGDLDLIAGHSLMRCQGDTSGECGSDSQVQLFENILGDKGHWLQLRLEGSGAGGSNRSAIGAKVTVQAGDIRQTQVVDGGHGHFGTQRDLVLHFGLGEACEAEVTVTWPDLSRSQDSYQLSGDARYHLVQGEAQATSW